MQLQESSRRSPQDLHSVALEHRLTIHEARTDRHEQRLTILEKAILGLAASVYVLAQDRLPQIAASIRGIILP